MTALVNNQRFLKAVTNTINTDLYATTRRGGENIEVVSDWVEELLLEASYREITTAMSSKPFKDAVKKATKEVVNSILSDETALKEAITKKVIASL